MPGKAPPATRSSRPTISQIASKTAAVRSPRHRPEFSTAMQHLRNMVADLVECWVGK